MYEVYTIDKTTKAESVLYADLNEKQAENICEQWGWMYDDGHKSYWIGYRDCDYKEG